MNINNELEIWKDVPGYGNHYQVSSIGRVRVKSRTIEKRHSSGCISVQKYSERYLKPSSNRGYQRVHLGYNNEKITVSVHKMVLVAFVGLPKAGEVCRHLDGNPSNNNKDNLAWGTHLENMVDRKLHGNYKVGQEHVMAKLKNSQVLFIKNSNLPGVDLRALFGVGYSQISRIKRSQSGLSYAKSN